MKVLVKYTGLLSEIVGLYSELLELPDNTCIKDLIRVLAEKHAGLATWLDKLPILLVRVNGVEVTGNLLYELEDSDEVELSTPLFEGG